MTTIYPGGITTSLPPSVAVESGGNITIAKTLYIGIQGRNEAGVNKPSTLVAASITVGSQVRITFNAANRTSGSTFPYWFAIASATDNAANAYLIGLWRNYQSDGRTIRPLNDLILTTDDQISLPPQSVSDPASLPTTTIEGQSKTVTSLSAIYIRFDVDIDFVDGVEVIQSSNGQTWIKHPGGLNYGAFPIGSDTGSFGCHQRASDLNPEVIHSQMLFTRPVYEPSVSASGFDPSVPITRLGFNNIYGSSLATGRRVRLSVFVDGQVRSQLLNGKVYCRVLGYVNPTTGLLDTEDGITPGNEMQGLNAWEPINFLSGFWSLAKALPVGYYLLVEISLAFQPGELMLPPGSVVSYTLSVSEQGGISTDGYTPRPEGGWIWQGKDDLRVVPSVGGAKALSSNGGAVHGLQSRIYLFEATAEQTIMGLPFDSTNNIISLTRDGTVTYREILPNSEAKLAEIDLQAGVGALSDWYSTTPANQSIIVTVTYPTKIKEGVISIAEKTAAFNVTRLRFYLRIGGQIYKQTTLQNVGVGLSEQTFTFASLTGFAIASPDTQTINDLFGNPTWSHTTGSGSLNGAVEVAVQYVYTGGEVTAIRHFLPIVPRDGGETDCTKCIPLILALG